MSVFDSSEGFWGWTFSGVFHLEIFTFQLHDRKGCNRKGWKFQSTVRIHSRWTNQTSLFSKSNELQSPVFNQIHRENSLFCLSLTLHISSTKYFTSKTIPNYFQAFHIAPIRESCGPKHTSVMIHKQRLFERLRTRSSTNNARTQTEPSTLKAGRQPRAHIPATGVGCTLGRVSGSIWSREHIHRHRKRSILELKNRVREDCSIFRALSSTGSVERNSGQTANDRTFPRT